MPAPFLYVGATAIAALLGYAFLGKKKGKGETEAIPAAIAAPGETVVKPEDISPEAALAKAAETTSKIAAKAIDTAIKEGVPITKTEVTAKSPGWAEVPNAGTTSGATSVTKSGEVDDAFSVLVAKAIAKGDIGALKDLLKQAELRGLTDTAESIADEIARLTKEAPPEVAPMPTVPLEAPTSTPLGRATISMKAGSTGPDVVAWQSVVKVKQDGIFGPITDKATRAWQSSHALTADGIVGPKTWTKAYALYPELATQPRVNTAPEPAPVETTAPIVKVETAPEGTPTTATVTSTEPVPPTIKNGSKGELVKTWQRFLNDKTLAGLTVDGIFGPLTEAKSKGYQTQQGLTADGIVGPKTWGKAIEDGYTAAKYAVDAPIIASPEPAPVPPPTTSERVTTTVTTTQQPAPEPDTRLAARELTLYLNSLGGLAGRYKEDRNKVKAWQSRMGLVSDGAYGRNTAKGVILQGFVPVVPYYWPRTNISLAKREFTDYVKPYAASDPARKVQWDKLLSDIPKA